MPPNQLRSLTYHPPSPPSFLRALKSQVSSSSSSSSPTPHGTTAPPHHTPIDDLLRPSPRTQPRNRTPPPSSSDSDDDLTSAAIVVTHPSHLTLSQAQSHLAHQRSHPPPSSSAATAPSPPRQRQTITQPGPSTVRAKRKPIRTADGPDPSAERATSPSSLLHHALHHTDEDPAAKRPRVAGKGDGGTLRDVKDLLRREREQRASDPERRAAEVGKADRDDKQKRQKERNRAARREKKKSGKGLSFDVQEGEDAG